MFGALSLKNPVILSLMASYSALGPVAYLEYEESKLLGTLAHSELIAFLQRTGMQELFYSKATFRLYVSIICVYNPYVCTNSLSAISEKNNTVNNL